jgi:hypothetical protein
MQFKSRPRAHIRRKLIKGKPRTGDPGWRREQVLATPHSDAAIQNENRSEFTLVDFGETIRNRWKSEFFAVVAATLLTRST